MRVGIDIDGVVCDFTRSFTGLAKDMRIIDEAWGIENQKTWLFDFPSEEVWKEIRRRYNWWLTCAPAIHDYEVDMLNRFIKYNDVFFITARHRTEGFSAEKQTELWLQSIGVDSHHANVLTAKAGNKGPLCEALGITAMIDDNVDNLTDLAISGVNAWCRTWQYNLEWEGRRTNSLAAFLEMVTEAV